jgi:small-conductance mechanosensitive channel
MKTKSWKETFIRAGRTFLQAFIGYIATNLIFNISFLSDPDVFTKWLIGLIGSAIAAGVAAVMNLPKREDGNA